MPAATHPDSREAIRAAKHAVGEMLPRFWALGQKLGSAKEALLTGTGISEADFARASERLRAGEDPAEALDDRFAEFFSLAGSPEECIRHAAAYKAAGIDELALTFSGPRAKEEIALIGAAIRQYRG